MAASPHTYNATPAVRPPTIKDVAAAASVGIKTVSRVMNGEPNVRPEMRERVLDAAARLNYRRNTIASSIRRLDQRTASIGLIVEDLTNPFAATLTRVVQDYALERGHLVLVGSSDGVADRERDVVTEFCSRRVDSLIIVPSGEDASYLEEERKLGTPIVFVDRPGKQIDADVVVSDNAVGVGEAVRHLGAHGHRRIAFLGDRNSIYTAMQRLEGFRTAMQELTGGVEDASGSYVRTDLRDEGEAGCVATELLSRDPAPTAIICGNNIATVGTVHAMERLGVRDTVALIGFDDIDLADLLEPALTVVAQDISELGRQAAELVFSRLAAPDEPFRHITVPVQLIARGSGEIPVPAGSERL